MGTFYSSVASLLSKYHFVTIKEFFETLRARQCEAQTSSVILFHVIHVVSVYLVQPHTKQSHLTRLFPKDMPLYKYVVYLLCMTFRLNVCGVLREYIVIYIFDVVLTVHRR
jgi:hypothetical protein